MPVPVVPVDLVLPGYRADNDRSGCRKLHPALLDTRVLRQTDRYENHHATVRHMDRQFDLGHVTVHLQIGTRLLRQKGTTSAFV